MNSIAQKIRESRIKAKMTEKELAKKCGLAETYIIQVENGKKIINEKAAENILKVFGEKVEFGFAEEAEPKIQPKQEIKKAPAKPQREEIYDVEPNDQWKGALANVIRKYPIYSMSTGKETGFKELPILNKKVETYAADKLSFYKVLSDDMKSLRIQNGDVIWVYQTKEISNNSIYLVEIGGKKSLRVLKREIGNKVSMSSCVKNEEPKIVDVKDATIIGRCVRVEIDLQ